MSAFTGSSPIPVYATITAGVIGFTGITGPTGNRGPTGESLQGFPGPTGSGISGINYTPGGLCFFFEDGRASTIQLNGQTGISYTDGLPNGILIARGLTTLGYSVLYSLVDNFVDQNKIIVTPTNPDFDEQTDQDKLKIRTLTFSGASIKGTSSDAAYIYIEGRTYNVADRIFGNTGEILYVSAPQTTKSVENTSYTAETNLLSVPLSFDRHPYHNNQNVNTPSFVFSSQNISGLSGATGYGFFSVNYGNFNIVDGKYQIVDGIKTANTTLYLGVTGSDDLTFKFCGISFDTGASFTPQIVTNNNFGSCCFCEIDTTEIKCLDYVSSSYCENVGGSFNTTSCLQRLSSGDCYAEGACCVNGKCINSSLDKCLKYKGTFFPGEVCAINGEDSSSFICPNTCDTPNTNTGKCCVRGFCLDLTSAECSLIPNSKFIQGPSCVSSTDTDCCADLKGACCTLNNGTYQCSDNIHPEDCEGIFHGPNSKCSEVECCGKNFIEDYFNANETCKITNNQPCSPIGTKMAGGYLVGIIGMPSPCSSYSSPLTAYGQPLLCRVLPRGEVNGPNSLLWPLKTCGGINGSDLGSDGALAKEVNIEYFNRTKSTANTIDLSYSLNATKKCLMKYGVPYIQQTYKASVNIQGSIRIVEWGDNIQYVGSSDYNASNGVFSYPIGLDGIDIKFLITEKHSQIAQENSLYKTLAKEQYGDNEIHMLWALVVAPDDAYDSNTLFWGMEEGRARVGSYNDEPITTFAVDGLLATRIFDESSKEKPKFWFRSGSGTSDFKAYDRFSFYTTNPARRSNWNFSVVETAIETNINVFKQNYSEMWDANNGENTCTKQISILNQIQYNGYNDWYIPSITELNYIYNNLTELNSGIALGGDSTISVGSDIEYWSSTSVPYLKQWSNSNHLDYSSYVIQESPDENTKNTKFRFAASDYSGLSDKKAYELSLAVAAGENMLTQAFRLAGNNAGIVRSRKRKLEKAKLRPVRRIPIIVGCVGDDISSYINDVYFNSCDSCPSSCPT